MQMDNSSFVCEHQISSALVAGRSDKCVMRVYKLDVIHVHVRRIHAGLRLSGGMGGCVVADLCGNE